MPFDWHTKAAVILEPKSKLTKQRMFTDSVLISKPPI